MKKNKTYPIILIIISAVLISGVLIFIFKDNLWNIITASYIKITDKEAVTAFIKSFGNAAPLIFISFQILQVIFAPIPGEFTGFVGGYIFGAFKGFFLSSIGLTIGSLINFAIGRLLGKNFIKKWIPKKYLDKFDYFLKDAHGLSIIFIFFILPGFPKDYLSIFLGISSLSYKIFIIIASIGRMPGTLLLSLQGAYLIDKAYLKFSLLFLFCAFILAGAYKFRNEIYDMLKKLDKK